MIKGGNSVYTLVFQAPVGKHSYMLFGMPLH